MSHHGLLRVSDALRQLDRGQIADHNLALTWLAQTLHEHTGVAIGIWQVDLIGGELPTQEAANDAMPVRVALAPGPTPGTATALGELAFFGQKADVQSEDEFRESTHSGPYLGADLTLAAGERALLFRVRLDFALCWVRVSGTAAQLHDLDAWRDLLPPALSGFLRGVDHERRKRFRTKQDQFFNTLLDTTPRVPIEVLGVLCQAWQEFAGALWAWLWLYNPLTRKYELTASASNRGIDAPADRPPETDKPTRSSVAAYALDTTEVVAVADAFRWQRTHNGSVYRVAIPDAMARMGGKSFVCIPIVAPGAALRAAMVDSTIRGAICLHYPHLGAMPSLPFSALKRMGQSTAQAIINSFMSRYQDILVQLNDMAGRYLTRVGSNPVADRDEYLAELIRLIQQRMQFQMVSVFYRVPFQDAVQCLASTGICKRDGDGITISKEKLSEVRYRAGDGRTGECYRTCRPLSFFERDLLSSAAIGNYYEIEPDTGARGKPFVVFPIPDITVGTAKPRAVGVIRCVGQELRRNRFLQLELDPLEFIARQVGVVLQAFETRIQREQTISIVKHDLYAPLNMIRDTVDRMRENAEAGRPSGEYDLADLETSAFFASNLVAQLDLSPGRLGDFYPQPTYLEGDIVAHVVRMSRHYAGEQRRMLITFDNLRVIPRLRIDRSMIARAIQNVVVNAIKYGTRGSTILIEGRESRAGYCLDIKNEGIGIEPEEVALIGQANYRSAGAKKAAVGLGLGIFIARSVMQKHGGKLFLTQAKNPTVFSLFFPVQLVC